MGVASGTESRGATLFAGECHGGAVCRCGVPVPEVLEVGWLPSGRVFSLESFVAGDDTGPSRKGWADLGRALGPLHTLPHTGFGLLEDRAGDFQGVASTPADGLRTRLRGWPFNAHALQGQPLVQHAPHLAAPLAALEPELLQVAETPCVLCHTDLHAGQLLWQDGRLAALLDFGDAAVGPPAWDMISVACFHGWEAAELVAGAACVACERNTALFGLLLALSPRGPRRRTEPSATSCRCCRLCAELFESSGLNA